MTALEQRNALRFKVAQVKVALEEYQLIPEQYRNPTKERQMVEAIHAMETEIAGLYVGT